MMTATSLSETPAAATETVSPGPAAAPQPAAATALSQADAPKPLQEVMPEKYRVMDPEGKYDPEASTRKLLESNAALEKRMGSGDAPPKTPEDYKIEGLPEGVSLDALKADEKFTGFLKSAHAKGLSNSQVSWALNEYLDRVGEQNAAPTAESTIAELRKVWADDQSFSANIKTAGKAAQQFAKTLGVSYEDIEQSMGNNPLAVRVLALAGKEMAEDSPPQAGAANASDMDLNSMMKSKAYWDSKDPMHEQIKAKVASHFANKYKA